MHLAIHRSMPFDKEGRELFAQSARQPLPFDERHQLLLIAFRKHPFKGDAGTLKKLLAQSLPFLARQIQATFHGHLPKSGPNCDQLSEKDGNQRNRAQERECTPDIAVSSPPG